MDSRMPIIFIKEELQYVFEMFPVEEKLMFLNGLLFNLTIKSKDNEQPIRITEDEKSRVISFLERKYLSDKKINKLIKFFRDIPDGKYIYVFLCSQQDQNFIDICRKTLEYYNKGCSHKEVAMHIGDYIGKIQETENFLNILPYNWNAVLPLKKIKIGEQDKKKRKCIYCDGYIGDGEKTSFDEIAHAIPEALGNTKLIQNEECDGCNSFFSNNAEEDLCNLLLWERLQYGLKGKKGYPIFQLDHSTYARYFDAENEDYEKDWGHFEVAKSIVKKEGKKGPVIVSSNREDLEDIETGSYITFAKDYLPMHVYKTLVKCVMGLIGNDKLTPFSKTIGWLRYDEEYYKLPRVAKIKTERVVKEPELYILTRKDELDYRLPYCFADLRVVNYIYVFIIPFCEKDKNEFITDKECMQFKMLLDIIYEKYEWITLSDITPQKIPKSLMEKEKLN